MIIDFYHVDAFEAANYEPIWRKLIEMGVDARMIAQTGHHNTASANWFDHERFIAYCKERSIPYHTHRSENAALAITTQNASILQPYRKRIRLMYGPVVYPFAWALQPHATLPFDAVLTHGTFYQNRFSNWLPVERLPCIGYPRYDRFFKKEIEKSAIHQKWGFESIKPIIVFMPTWGENTGFDLFFEAITQLSSDFNIVLRPHHCTLRFESNRMAMMKQSGLLILDNAFDLDEAYVGADVIISDVRSGSLFEACLCDKPTVGI